MQTADHNKIWIFFGVIIFAAAGALSIILTDLILTPIASGVEKTFTDRLWFSKSPLFLLSCIFSPMAFAGYATYRWLFKSSKFFGSWINVAIAAWLSLALNPVIWLLVSATYFLFGVIAMCIFFFTGLAMSILWRLKNA